MSAILTPSALAYANREFWQRHADNLSRLRQFALTVGEPAVCAQLEAAGHLAVRRAMRARQEHEKLKESQP